MNVSKSSLIKGALVSVVAGVTFAAASAPASAETVCNRRHECWHVRDHYNYPARLGIVFHNDNWRARHNDRSWHWRAEHRDHGYYRNGVWRRF